MRYPLVLTVLGVSLPCAAAPFNRSAWQEDFASLKSALEERYANLAWFASPQGGVDLPALEQRTARALAAAEDDAAARAVLTDFVRGFHDGHLAIVPSLAPAPGKPPPAPPAPDYAKMTAVEGCAALGFAPVRPVAFSLPFETLPGARLESDGLSRAFRAGTVAAADGTIFGLVRIPRFREEDAPPAACIEAWTSRAAASVVDVEAIRAAARDSWLATLATQLHRFGEQKVAAVIVDVGGNSGGNDTGDWVARLFTTRDVHSARLLVTAAPMATAYFDEELEEVRKAQKLAGASPAGRGLLDEALKGFEARKAAISSRRCALGWVWRERRPWNPDGCSRLVDAGFASGYAAFLTPGAAGNAEVARSVYWPAKVDGLRGAWNGPVYVLADGATASSAEMFASLIQDSGVGRLVGRPTSGDGCGFMFDAPPVELPRSRLRVRVPNCVRLRSDGTDAVAGAQPDVPILPTEGETERGRARRLVESLAADLHGTTARARGDDHALAR